MLILLSFDENKVKHCAPPPSPSPSLPVCNTFTFSGKQGQIKNMGRLKSIAVRSYLISTLCEMYGFCPLYTYINNDCLALFLHYFIGPYLSSGLIQFRNIYIFDEIAFYLHTTTNGTILLLANSTVEK